MLVDDPDYRLGGQDMQLFSQINNVMVSVIIGVSFGALLWGFISLSPSLISPYESLFSFGTCFAIDGMGAILVATVTYDVVLRIVAKRELVRFLTGFPEENYEALRIAVERGQPPGVLWPFLAGNEERDTHFSKWFFLGSFLNTPIGRLASQALFQQSRSGRIRYIDQVIAAARQKRQQYDRGFSAPQATP
jgi:hypothetical protein